MTKEMLPAVVAIAVAALCTLGIVAALVYMAAWQGDHDSKLALIAMVSGTGGASAGVGASLVVLRPKTDTALPTNSA